MNRMKYIGTTCQILKSTLLLFLFLLKLEITLGQDQCFDNIPVTDLGTLKSGEQIEQLGNNLTANTTFRVGASYTDCVGNEWKNSAFYYFNLDNPSITGMDITVSPLGNAIVDVALLIPSVTCDTINIVRDTDQCNIGEGNQYRFKSSDVEVCVNVDIILMVSSKEASQKGSFDILIEPIESTYCDNCQNGDETEVDGPYRISDVTIVPTLSTTSDGSITINSIEGGNSPFTYSLDGGSFQSDNTFSNLSAGNYVAIAQDINNCTTTFPFEIPANDTIEPPIVSEPVLICNDNEIPEVSAKGANIKWYSNAEATEQIAEGNTYLPTEAPDTLYATQTISNIESDPVPLFINTKQVQIQAEIEANAIIGYAPLSVNFSNADTAITYLWDFGDGNQAINNAPFNVYSDEGVYTVTLSVTDEDGCPNTDTLQIEVIPPLNIPNGISPNGDGVNDIWIIDDITRVENNTIKMFNQWGNLVYEVENYQNDWSGDSLTDGTYFFTIEFSNGLPSINGYLMVLR